MITRTLFFSFSSFQNFPSVALYRCCQAFTEALHASNRACEELPWCRSPTPSPDRPKIAAQGQVCFSPQNELTPPPKGGGAGYHLTWLAGILMQRSPVLFRRKRRILRVRGLLSAVALATAGHNRLTRLQRGLSGALVVSFPYLASRTAHRATQGRVWVHHFFLERFCPGRTAKSRSSL